MEKFGKSNMRKNSAYLEAIQSALKCMMMNSYLTEMEKEDRSQ